MGANPHGIYGEFLKGFGEGGDCIGDIVNAWLCAAAFLQKSDFTGHFEFGKVPLNRLVAYPKDFGEVIAGDIALPDLGGEDRGCILERRGHKLEGKRVRLILQ